MHDERLNFSIALGFFGGPQAVQEFRGRRGAHHAARDRARTRVDGGSASLRALPAEDARRRPAAHLPGTGRIHDGLRRRHVRPPPTPTKRELLHET